MYRPNNVDTHHLQTAFSSTFQQTVGIIRKILHRYAERTVTWTQRDPLTFDVWIKEICNEQNYWLARYMLRPDVTRLL